MVYIVTFEEWDDFEIKGVFSSEEKAEQYLIDRGQDPDQIFGPLYIREEMVQ